MAHSLWQVLQSGQKYAALWPRHAVVAAMTETRVVPAVKLAAKLMPAAAVLNFVMQWQWQDGVLLPQAIVTSLFLLSLPLQGWYWLGRRALSPLDPRLHHWYLELTKKLQMQPQAKPTHLDLARVLRKALQELPPDEH